VAHRGLWSPGGAPENSLAAFQAACAAGYGIELDVRLSADGEAMVFHDETLERMTGRPGRLADRSAAELSQLKLAGTEETIPTLVEALALIGRRALVQIELKTPPGGVGPLEQRIHEVIMDHAGPVAMIGFNPYSHAWFAERFPGVLRGLNSYSYAGDPHLGAEQRQSYAALEHIGLAKPHFLALGLDILSSEAAVRRRAAGLPVVAWTVRSPEERMRVEDACDNVIFEGFAP
jgi:glycerophosphoryl diester phosphodiesterase